MPFTLKNRSKRCTPWARLGTGLAAGIDKADSYISLSQKVRPAQRNLTNPPGGSANCNDSAFHDDRIAKACRFDVSDRKLGYGKGPFPTCNRGLLIDAKGTDHFCPRALKPAQVIGVINNPACVRVIEIDPHRKTVPGAIELASRGQQSVVRVGHRHRV